MSYYQHHVFFCTNERDDGRPSCGERCAGELRDYAKKKVLEDHANRKALWARLQAALEGEPDPWFEGEKARVDARQFIPIAVA